MASYVVIKPPGLQGDAASVRFIRDGFSRLALVSPPVWMLVHRLWLHAVLFVIVATGLTVCADALGAESAGIPVIIALNVLVALESGEIRQRHFLSKGWTIDAVIAADNLDQAEEIYFSSAGRAANTQAPVASYPAGVLGASVLGLIDDARGR